MLFNDVIRNALFVCFARAVHTGGVAVLHSD